MRAGRLVAILAAALLLVTAQARATDPVAVVTEIQARSGKVEVKTAGADWQNPKPLLSLRAGDQVRAVGDGRTVLVFTGGRGPDGAPLRSSEVAQLRRDPTNAGCFSNRPVDYPMTDPRAQHAVAKMQETGELIVIGGRQQQSGEPFGVSIATAEIFSPDREP